MVDVPFTSFAFPATGAPTSRTLPDRLAEVVNVKDYGAYGDGVHDDTAALQAAIDAAFGPASSPHGGLSNGYVRNRPLFFPNGTYNISAPLNLTMVQGAWIYGAGKFATRIVNTATSGGLYYGTIFLTNGFDFALIENMTLAPAAPGAGTANRGFNLAWNGTGTVSLHAIMFRNVRFAGGDMGCGIGDDLGSGVNAMGSEILFVGCDFVGCTTGAKGFNFNALDMTVLGGSFQNCGRAIDTNGTSTFSYISGVEFSGSTEFDYVGCFDGQVLEACNSTSSWFLKLLGSVNVKTKACWHHPASGGDYGGGQSFCIMDGCVVSGAVFQTAAHNPGGPGNKLYMRGCSLPGDFISGSTNPPTITENI